MMKDYIELGWTDVLMAHTATDWACKLLMKEKPPNALMQIIIKDLISSH